MKTYKINSPPTFSRTTKHETHYGVKEYTTEFYDNIKSLSVAPPKVSDKLSR